MRDGDHYIVSGQKKWITGGLLGDWFTLAVKTGGPKDGIMGTSLLLLDRDLPGVAIRKMEKQNDSVHHITFITLDDVRVPVDRLIGEENQGFMYLMHNFNHERWIIAIQGARCARTCYSEAMKYAMQRKVFGKPLIENQVVRFKLAEMARWIEAVYDTCERIGYQYQTGVSDMQLGGHCALLKVNASKCMEYCAREASQIFGGSSVVKEGKGKVIERLYRNVRLFAIPGGSEEVLLDFAIRQGYSRSKL